MTRNDLSGGGESMARLNNGEVDRFLILYICFNQTSIVDEMALLCSIMDSARNHGGEQ